MLYGKLADNGAMVFKLGSTLSLTSSLNTMGGLDWLFKGKKLRNSLVLDMIRKQQQVKTYFLKATTSLSKAL